MIIPFFSFNLELISTCEFLKKLKLHSPKRLVQFQLFGKLTLANYFQIKLETVWLPLQIVNLNCKFCKSQSPSELRRHSTELFVSIKATRFTYWRRYKAKQSNREHNLLLFLKVQSPKNMNQMINQAIRNNFQTIEWFTQWLSFQDLSRFDGRSGQF